MDTMFARPLLGLAHFATAKNHTNFQKFKKLLKLQLGW